MTVDELLIEDEHRMREKHTLFDPVTGVGAPLKRFKFRLKGHPIPVQYLPEAMRDEPIVQLLTKYKNLDLFIVHYLKEVPDDQTRESVLRAFERVRVRHDFFYWAYVYTCIKPKAGGDVIPFKLNRAQRNLVSVLESMRLADKPIRLILLKARQWGGSTAVQIYMAWIQLIHRKGWNSLIVAHQRDAALEVKGMFSTLIEHYPLWLLHDPEERFSDKEPKITPFEGAQSIDIVPQRKAKIKVGTAERPDSARGGDSALVHCTEVAFWTKTENRTPEQIVRSACSGVLFAPLTMEVYESTANGTGNYFHREWERAKRGESDKVPLFVPWFDIEMYEIPPEDPRGFAQELIENQESEEGKYLWWLWEQGATLPAINWYTHNRKRFNDQADMASEYPSDDIEAFKHSGAKVFDQYLVEALRGSCCDPRYIGEVDGGENGTRDALRNLSFREDRQGKFRVWQLPEVGMRVVNRYLTVVDVGGRSNQADYSVVTVFDRYWMMEGDPPEVVAEWYGHTDHDLLAWNAARIAAFYCDSLLVIESNTLETKDRERDTDGDHTSYILNQIAGAYANLYARKGHNENIVAGAPRKWGFHTNSATKPMIIDHLVRMIREGGYVEHEQGAIDEYLCYEKKSNGGFGAIQGRHDDRLMTRAIGLFICYCEMPLPRVIEKKERPHTLRLDKPVTVATF